jgi:hypothetical protein
MQGFVSKINIIKTVLPAYVPVFVKTIKGNSVFYFYLQPQSSIYLWRFSFPLAELKENCKFEIIIEKVRRCGSSVCKSGRNKTNSFSKTKSGKVSKNYLHQWQIVKSKKTIFYTCSSKTNHLRTFRHSAPELEDHYNGHLNSSIILTNVSIVFLGYRNNRFVYFELFIALSANPLLFSSCYRLPFPI